MEQCSIQIINYLKLQKQIFMYTGVIFYSKGLERNVLSLIIKRRYFDEKIQKNYCYCIVSSIKSRMTSLPVFAAATGSGSKTDSELKKTSIEKAFDGSFFSASVLQLQMLKTVHSTKKAMKSTEQLIMKQNFSKPLLMLKKVQ